jgi:hypothetical protein
VLLVLPKQEMWELMVAVVALVGLQVARGAQVVIALVAMVVLGVITEVVVANEATLMIPFVASFIMELEALTVLVL